MTQKLIKHNVMYIAVQYTNTCSQYSHVRLQILLYTYCVNATKQTSTTSQESWGPKLGEAH